VKLEDLVTLNEGVHDEGGPWALIGAGTGLGEAIAVLDSGGRREVLASEGGHASFAPRNEMEIGILRFLLKRYEHVSWERVLSGDGLVNIAEAIAHQTGEPLPAEVARAALYARADAPAMVTDTARAGDPVCRGAVETFCSLYGAEAGNLALKALATGGVYVGGGIAPRLATELQDGRFRTGFLSKGRMRPLLETMPVRIVLDEMTTVLGAAALAARRATVPPHTRHIVATTP
jgi:glucokinase